MEAPEVNPKSLKLHLLPEKKPRTSLAKKVDSGNELLGVGGFINTGALIIAVGLWGHIIIPEL